MTNHELLKRKQHCIENRRCFVSLDPLEKDKAFAIVYDELIGLVATNEKYYKIKDEYYEKLNKT